MRSTRVTAIFVSIAVSWAVSTSRSAEPIPTESGLISGAAAGHAAEVQAYKGIPFAAPPVGVLRWKPPQPVSPWKGVRACTEYGPWCPQPKSTIIRIAPSGDRQSEDCLYLNVWTAAKEAAEKRPGMVWIHGGGWTTGSGAALIYDGTVLARQGAVVVTINYRLGPLGFFAHPLLSKESPQGVSGNYGHLDQIAALQWVQKNIAAFGGDPACVTIFGESAGAGSVCRLLVSPPAKGLFQRAIVESGSGYGFNRRLRETRGGQESMEKVGQDLAAKLGCDKAADPLAALRVKSVAELLAASEPAQGLYGKGVHYAPIIDGWAIPDDPGDMFTAGKQYSVPLLIGTNADEGTLFVPQMPVQHVAGYQWMVRSLYSDKADEMLKLVPCDDDQQVKAALGRLSTIQSFVSPARMAAKAMSRKQAKTFLYHFTRVAPALAKRGLGATHTAELPYVFGTLPTGPAYEEQDRRLAATIGAYWVQFAKTGDPNVKGLPQWPAYDAAGDQYLELGDKVQAGHGLYREACDLLEHVVAQRRAGQRADER